MRVKAVLRGKGRNGDNAYGLALSRSPRRSLAIGMLLALAIATAYTTTASLARAQPDSPSAQGKATAEKSAAERSADEKLAAEKSATEKAATEKSAIEKSASSPSSSGGSTATTSPAGESAANQTTAGQTGAGDTKVHVGIFASQIHEVNLKGNSFTLDFYIWFRWKNPTLQPHKTFEVANGRIDNSEEASEPIQLADGSYYSYRHVVATITQFWDVTRFPMDDHTLLIYIDDSANEEDKLQYVADTKNTGIDPQAKAPGWSITDSNGKVTTKTYATNYGDTTLPTGNASKYSRFVFEVELERGGYGAFLKLFFGLFVATAIAFLAFFIKPTEVDPRFGLGVGAIFAAVASLYVVTSSLPDSQKMTMADMLHMLAFFVIFVSLVESTWSLKAYSSDDDAQIARSKRVDRISFIALSSLYVFFTALSVYTTWW